MAGEVVRTWRLASPSNPRGIDICLCHDTWVGTRSVAVDYEEVESSLGVSPPFFSRGPDRITFAVGESEGVIEIEKV